MSSLEKYMITELLEIGPEATLREAAEKMKIRKMTYLLIVEGGKHIGIVTEADLARRSITVGLDPTKTKTRALMTAPLITVDAQKSVEEANEMMKKYGIRHLPVAEKGKVVGLITMLGLLRYFIDLSQKK